MKIISFLYESKSVKIRHPLDLLKVLERKIKYFLKAKKRPFLYSKSSTEMVIFIGLFQTVRLSKWYLHFDTSPRGEVFFFFSLPIQFILLTFAAVNKLAMTYQMNPAQQRNLSFFAFFSALYLVISDILLTHTHTHRRT